MQCIQMVKYLLLQNYKFSYSTSGIFVIGFHPYQALVYLPQKTEQHGQRYANDIFDLKHELVSMQCIVSQKVIGYMNVINIVFDTRRSICVDCSCAITFIVAATRSPYQYSSRSRAALRRYSEFIVHCCLRSHNSCAFRIQSGKVTTFSFALNTYCYIHFPLRERSGNVEQTGKVKGKSRNLYKGLEN